MSTEFFVYRLGNQKINEFLNGASIPIEDNQLFDTLISSIKNVLSTVGWLSHNNNFVSLFFLLFIGYMAMNERLIDSYRIVLSLNEDVSPSFAFKSLSSFIIGKYTCRIILSVIIYGDNINHKSHPFYDCWPSSIELKWLKSYRNCRVTQCYNEKETK